MPRTGGKFEHTESAVGQAASATLAEANETRTAAHLISDFMR
jgi:hypothetical protein